MGKTVIDGDSISFICSKDSLEESIALVDSLIGDILKITNADEYVIFLSKGPYFRHSINPGYKGSRKPASLLWIKSLHAYMIEKYFAVVLKDIEADDGVAYYKQLYPDATIAAIDKDVLKQVEGTHYNYRNREWVTTSEEDSHKWLYLQSIMGDSGDSIVGIPRIGIKKAEKLLEGQESAKYQYIALREYTKQYGDILGKYEYYKNFFQVYLLRREEEIRLFTEHVPTVGFIKIVKEENENEEEW